MAGEKIKILMFLGNTGRGGAQTYAMNVLRNIDRARFHIDFVVNYRHQNGYENEMERLGCKIHILPKFKGTNYKQYMRALNDILKEGRYDIVHGHVSSSAALYLKAAKNHSCVTVAHSHSAGYRGNFVERTVKWLFTQGAKRHADYWFACSQVAAERLFGKRYRENPNYYDIPNAINTENYRFDAQVRQSIRRQLGIGDDTVLYGHVGSFSTPKNHMYLIQVFREIRKLRENARLILVGDGPLRDKILQETEKYGLEDQVILTGNVPNVNAYMMAMDAMIFPSLFEGFPVTLLEAQATGLYCLVSDSITTEASLTDRVTSLSLSQEPACWAQAAQLIPAADRCATNREIADSIFNMQTAIDRLMELYEMMAAKKRN